MAHETTTDITGGYTFDGVTGPRVQITFSLVNFSTVRRDVKLSPAGGTQVDVVLHLSLSADVTVTGSRTFTNLADAAEPAQNLVGIAESASQGAITSRQLQTRPLMRAGEVLETVPGVVISQHSGEGKANQYYLRGFNLDHGTDFATTVAGMPVNMPTHAHGHGYSDLELHDPRARQRRAVLEGPVLSPTRVTSRPPGRRTSATSTRSSARSSASRAATKASAARSPPRPSDRRRARCWPPSKPKHNDGPWVRPDDFRKVNGLVRYSRGNTLSGLRSRAWATRALELLRPDPAARRERRCHRPIRRVDSTDGGDTYRYSGSLDWQRTRQQRRHAVSAYGIGYDLNLFSNFTLLPRRSGARRPVPSGRSPVRRRRQGVAPQNDAMGRPAHAEHLDGVQLRNDNITTLGLSHTQARRLLNTVRHDRVLQTSAAGYGQHEIAWTPWLRTLAGLRVDGYQFRVTADDPANGGIRRAGPSSARKAASSSARSMGRSSTGNAVSAFTATTRVARRLRATRQR